MIRPPLKCNFAVVCTVVGSALIGRGAKADDFFGLYVGGAAGQSRIETSNTYAGKFGENRTAFKGILGIRPVSLLGAEVDYAYFGHPHIQTGLVATDVKMRGESAFGVLYLPITVVDVFVKAGVAHIDTTLGAYFKCSSNEECPAIAFPPLQGRNNTGFAGGAGVQAKLGDLAVRGEYEHFNAAGGAPRLITVGLTWSFN